MATPDFAPDARTEYEPRSVEAARDAIADTRDRLSATLDQIEHRIDDTKQEIQRRADVLRQARERIRAHPWGAVALGAGAGFVLGLVTGRDD